MPLIDQVRLTFVFHGSHLVWQTQEERLTNDLRDIMREANILEDLDAEKLEQENLEALKSIEGPAAPYKENREESLTAVEEVDVEGVWSPQLLIQVVARKFSSTQRTQSNYQICPLYHHN